MADMKTLEQKLVPGIVGISTWVDFAYQREMQKTAVALAGTDGPINQLRSVVVTLDFHALILNLQNNRRDLAEGQVTACIESIARAGADFLVVTSGTTSTLTAPARAHVALPFLELATAPFKETHLKGPVGLLATSYATAGGQFHAAAKDHGIKLVLPSDATAKRVDQAIFSELVRGAASEKSLQVFRDAIGELQASGAQSIILGNTDLTLVADILQKGCALPLIDSTKAHARAAARAAMTSTL